MSPEQLHQEVKDTIEFIKHSYKEHSGYEDPVEVFRWGNCGNFCRLLLQEFPDEAEPYAIYLDGKIEHIITRVRDKYYDVGGEITIELYIEYLMRLPLGAYGKETVTYDLARYTIKPVTDEEVAEYMDNYNDPIVMINGKDSIGGISIELERMVRIKEDLFVRNRERKRQEGSWYNDE